MNQSWITNITFNFWMPYFSFWMPSYVIQFFNSSNSIGRVTLLNLSNCRGTYQNLFSRNVKKISGIQEKRELQDLQDIQ